MTHKIKMMLIKMTKKKYNLLAYISSLSPVIRDCFFTPSPQQLRKICANDNKRKFWGSRFNLKNLFFKRSVPIN